MTSPSYREVKQGPSDLLEDAASRLASAKAHLKLAQAAQKRNYDGTHQHEVLQAGDLVFLSARLLRAQGAGDKKLGRRWFGQFTILKRVNDLAYVIDFPPGMRLHRKVNIGFLRKCKVSARNRRVLPFEEQDAASPTAPGHGRPASGGRAARRQAGHPYAIEAILKSRERKKRDGATAVPGEMARQGARRDLRKSRYAN
ncbi:retrotransposon nucleocapsid related [Cystoisospora suis]|uniref:Retrotransposon nucleocapsid related n=1 Tax=Cystoisospora suis TaxID=483139 RepID=A0A2C6KZG0_9APIC|nr:retrotransposon nucleocapsid related [Cystoisospora suis]